MGGKFGKLTHFKPAFGERKFGELIDQPIRRLLIVSTNLDGFSLANHRRFAKFA